jgi:glutaredoxin-related protein
VPHHRGVRAPRCGFSRKTNDALTSLFRKRAARIDVGPDCIAVMD